MRILLLGEASFVHSTLRKGFEALGHDVVLVSAGCIWDCPRDIDVSRNMRWGKLSGLKVVWKILANLKVFVGNDIVQMNDFHTIPLKVRWNELFFRFLKRFNKKVVRGCWGDDIVVLEAQARGVLAYSDTHIGTKAINAELHKWRIVEQNLPEFVSCCRYVNRHADAFVACLYEYYVYYNTEEYKARLHYMPLPMEIPETVFSVQCSVFSESKQLHTPHSPLNTEYSTQNTPIRVLVGIQAKRDYIKGAAIIADLVERVAAENPGKIEVKRVHDVPYNEYLKMLDEADVLVDQLYSYTPSMNSLAAMAHGTVVIGGGEEEFYEFIGEKDLRPIINVRPEDDEYNMAQLRATLLYPEKIELMKRQGLEFIRKHHDYMKVAKGLIDFYGKLLDGDTGKYI